MEFTENHKNEIYDAARKRWGQDGQVTVAIEELGELIVELAKAINDKRKGDTLPLIDELADARIMIEQVERIFNCPKLVQARMNYKISRLEKLVFNLKEDPHGKKVD